MTQRNDACPALFQEMTRHFLTLPPGTLVRDVWHTHSRKQLGTFIRRTDFADRTREELGYLVPQVYSEHLRSSDYRIRWVPIEDTAEAIDAFCRVFDRFNVYTTLNRYPLPYAIARLKAMSAEYRLRLAEQNEHIPKKRAEIPGLREQLAQAEDAIPKGCFVDLAFDFDAGATGAGTGIAELIPRVLRLLDFCTLYEVPHGVFFSGGRGFHVVVPYTALDQPLAEDNHLINRRVVELIQEETGDLGIDWAIYSNRRQFRLPNTRHQKSGLHKVALVREDLVMGEQHILERARVAIPVPPVEDRQCTYLANLFALAASEVRSTRRCAVDPKRVKSLPAARQSQVRRVPGTDSEATRLVVTALEELTHPPCVLEALRKGVPDPASTSRNQVTVLLACYLKSIGRNAEETSRFLVRHATDVLAPFSYSSTQDIENSTRTATATVFRHERYQFNCHTARRMGLECNDTCELHAHTRESATSRRLHKVPVTSGQPTNGESSGSVFPDVGALRIDMARRVTDYVNQGRASRQAKKSLTPLLVKSPAGTGKTTVVFDRLADLGLRTLWVASRLDLFDNIPPAIRARWRRIEGRHPEIPLPKGGVLPATCAYSDLARRLRERRINVNERLCKDCDGRIGCAYYEQFEDRTSSFFVQQPMYLHKIKDYASQFDVVVFDEDILGQFIEEVTIQEPDVRQLSDMLRDLRADLEFLENYKDASDLTPLICLLEALAHLLAQTKVQHAISGTVLHQRLAEAYEEVFEGIGAEGIPIHLPDALRAIPTRLDTIVDCLHFDPRDLAQPVPLQFLNTLLPVLRFELFQRHATSNLSRLHFRSVRSSASEGGAEGKRSFSNVLEVVFKAEPPPLPTPTILLDATGKPAIYERLLGIRPDVYAPTMTFENRVTQIYSSSGSYGVMRQAVHRKRMLDLLLQIVAEEPRTLVVCKQRLVSELKPVLPPEADVTHFYGNRGSNEYKEFRRVVIFGMPGMAPETVLRYAGALYYQDSLISDTEFAVRRYEGNDVGVQVLLYKEPLIQALVETAREDEVLQSVHRIRPCLDASKDILLFTNLVVPGLPVTRLVSTTELREPIRHGDTMERVDLLARVVQVQFDALGFVCPSRTLWPVVGKDEHPVEVVAYLKGQGAWMEVGPDDRVGRTTLHDHKEELRQRWGLSRYDVSFRSARGRTSAELWGKDASCIERARAFFAGHPLFGTEVMEIIGG